MPPLNLSLFFFLKPGRPVQYDLRIDHRFLQMMRDKYVFVLVVYIRKGSLQVGLPS